MSDLKLVHSRFLDKLFAATESREFPNAAVRQRLEQSHDILEVARELDLIDAASQEHFQRDWFASDGYWSDCGVEVLLRKALIDALQMSESLGVPIRGYWLSGAGEFAVPILPSPVQVTMLVMTPEFRNLRAGPAEGVLSLLPGGAFVKG